MTDVSQDQALIRTGFYSSSIMAILVALIDIGMTTSTILYPISSINDIQY